jgi:hypothetical protein
VSYRVDIPHLDRLPVDRPAPCRLCGDPAWLADPVGPVHACCARWAGYIEAGRPCLSCQAAKAGRRRG